ncbi:MAG: M14 family metallopeptidase [bacterium]
MFNTKKIISILLAVLLSGVAVARDMGYRDIIPEGNYRSEVTPPDQILGFKLGSQAATPEQLIQAIYQWQGESELVQIEEYAKTHENRPLLAVKISSKHNLQRQQEIEKGMARLANPKGLSAESARKLTENLPAIAWMAYSIHGNESSGSDAALATIYYLIANKSEHVQSMLNEMVIIVDPSMNPDGRHRFIQQITEGRGEQIDLDAQSWPHTGYWPAGRTNHYFFDLNRDFLFGIHPETRGRVKLINQWNPLLMIDAHEQGSLSTYLFAPPREPINKNVYKQNHYWGDQFVIDQSSAFDQQQWPYFNGEWFEDLYPGYSSYAQFRGTLCILYEQARIHDDGIRGFNGKITSYAESVDHHFTSTLSNLDSLQKNRQAMLHDFYQQHLENISSTSQYAQRGWAVLPTDNTARLEKFMDVMDLQGFEVYRLTEPRIVSSAENRQGDLFKKYKLPIGTLIIPNRQPQARLLATMMEFEAGLSDDLLVKERQSILRGKGSLMYDVTAWNLPMMYDLQTLQIKQDMYSPKNAELINKSMIRPAIKPIKEQSLAYFVAGEDDRSVRFAVQAMQSGLKVRLANEPGVFAGQSYQKGSVFVMAFDQVVEKQALFEQLNQLAKDNKIQLQSTQTGYGQNDLPDLGGSRFTLLSKPVAAILTHGTTDSYDMGAMWYQLDSVLSMPLSKLNVNLFSYADLRPYNVLIIPDQQGEKLPEQVVSKIEKWVRGGGTLIASSSAILSFNKKGGLSKLTKLDDVFDAPESFQTSVYQSWLSQNSESVPIEQAYQHDYPEVDYPWMVQEEQFSIDADSLKRKNHWQQQFTPQGAMLSVSINTESWISAGTNEIIPVLSSNGPVLVLGSSSKTVGRYGVLKADKTRKEALDAGWLKLPPGKKLQLRMSGLLWPEAAQRFANTTAIAVEPAGQGQMISFTQQPVFRGSTLGTARLFMNAVVYGPGSGSSAQVPL